MEFEGALLPLKYAKPALPPLSALPEPRGERKPETYRPKGQPTLKELCKDTHFFDIRHFQNIKTAFGGVKSYRRNTISQQETSMSKNYFFCAPAVRGFLLDRYAVCAVSRRLVGVSLTVYGRARVKVPVNLAERRRQVRTGMRGRIATIEAR